MAWHMCRYLSNHLPHALISLWHLGASSRRLLAYAALYSTRLEPPRQQETDKPPVDEEEEERRLYAASAWHDNGDGDGYADGDEAAADDGDRSNRNSMQRSGAREKRRMQLVTVSSSNWRQYLGHRRHWRSYFDFFSNQLSSLHTSYDQQQQQQPTAVEAKQSTVGALSASEHSAVRELLAHYAPVLLPGGSHSALHPIIHSGWALSCGRAGLSTLCEGLAYLCYSYHSLDPPGGSNYSTAGLTAVEGADSQSLLATLRSTVSACREQHILSAMEAGVLCVPYCEMDVGAFQRKLVWLSLHQPGLLHSLSCLPQLPASVPASDSLVSSLFLHTLLLFAVSGDDFFMLHCSTSLYALSQLLPMLPSEYQPTGVRYGLKYILASWIAQGLPGVEDADWLRSGGEGDIEQAVQSLLDRARQGDGRVERAGSDSSRRLFHEVSWDELRGAAVDSDDEHTQKVVHVCWERSGSAHSSSSERKLAHFVAWKRLTDEDETLFARS